MPVDLTLPQHGLANYRHSNEPVWRLAVAAAEQSLAASPLPPDLLLYVTETDPEPAGGLARVAEALGLPTVAHMSVGGHGCGNLGPALQVATAALTARRCGLVLVVLADRAGQRPRVMASGLSVFSDGAASCLVSREPLGTSRLFTVDAVVTRSRVRPDTAGWDMLHLAELAQECAELTAEECGRRPADFDHVLFANYRVVSQRFFTSALRCPEDRLLVGPVAELGHCFSADILTTLDRCAADGHLRPGGHALASAIGPHTWSAIALGCP
jgi:3-oxoacyl-[acyl-carrier-protein] synthase-3